MKNIDFELRVLNMLKYVEQNFEFSFYGIWMGYLYTFYYGPSYIYN